MFCSTFLSLFYAIFLTSIAVGPVFITISSIGLTYGLKNSLFSVIGVIIGNCIYLSIGALISKQIITTIPEQAMLVISFFASLFLLYVAYSFFKKDVSKMQTQNFFKPSVKTIFKMFAITLSSPVVISGYVITFLTFANELKKSFFTGFIGGLLGAVIAYGLIAIVSGLIGNKIKHIDNTKYFTILNVLNKIAGILLGSFAIVLAINFIKTIIIAVK